MNKAVCGMIAWVALALLSGSPAAAQEEPPVMGWNIPRLERVVVDGHDADWGPDGGLKVQFAPDNAPKPSPQDFQADVRMAWDGRGLLVLLRIRDDTWVEDPADDTLSRGDVIMLSVSPRYGYVDLWRWILTPAMAPGRETIRIRQDNFRGTVGVPRTPPQITARRTRAGDSCVMEVLIPWDVIGVKPEVGAEIGVQLDVGDVDALDGSRPGHQARWHPMIGASYDHRRACCVRLAKAPGEERIAGAFHVDFPRLLAHLNVEAPASDAGKAVAIASAGRKLTEATLAAVNGRAEAHLALPLPIEGSPRDWMDLLLAGKPVDRLRLPGEDKVRERISDCVLHLTPFARPAVFSGEQFPAIDCWQGPWAKSLIGPYRIHTTFYDKDRNAVKTAAAPGRYGAVVDLVAQDGRMHRRFLTLFRTARPLGPPLAESLGLPPEAARAFGGELAGAASWKPGVDFDRDAEMALLFAGLHEMPPGAAPGDFYTHPRQLDRQWWVGLKRKLYGQDTRWPGPFQAPRAMAGKPAPVVREGTLAQAGMKPDAAAGIDAVLTAWAADSNEAFAACVVRNGVIVLHKAYGLRNGKPMTVTTKSHIASATKMLSGLCMMMLADQGLIDLDAPAATYLPPLGRAPVGRPITLRNLYTHTSGLTWHETDPGASDLAERMSVLMPHLDVGMHYYYSNIAMELGCQALEAVSGESLPNFYRNHLLKPLGCTDSDMPYASYGTRTVPLDLARVGQMLLNRGAYGDKRFLSDRSFDAFLPRPLTPILGPHTQEVYGIGTMAMDVDILGPGTFGHGGATAPTVRICPAHNLVITMTRNAGGRNFEKYHPQFLRAVIAGIAR